MATKIQQILETTPNESVLFGPWLSSQGLDARGQYAYMKSGWLDRISKGVYKIHGTEPSLFAAVSSYNTQLRKSCVVGAYTALELRGYSHYLSMGKSVAYLFTDKSNKLPSWLLKEEWDMTIKYMTTSFLGDELLVYQTFKDLASHNSNHQELCSVIDDRANNILCGMLLTLYRNKKLWKPLGINETVINMMKEKGLYPIDCSLYDWKKRIVLLFLNRQSVIC